MENNQLSHPAKGVALIIGAGDATGGEIAKRFARGWLYRLYDAKKCR